MMSKTACGMKEQRFYPKNAMHILLRPASDRKLRHHAKVRSILPVYNYGNELMD